MQMKTSDCHAQNDKLEHCRNEKMDFYQSQRGTIDVRNGKLLGDWGCCGFLSQEWKKERKFEKVILKK